MGFTTQVKAKQDLSFSSASEIQTYILSNRGGINLGATDVTKYTERQVNSSDGVCLSTTKGGPHMPIPVNVILSVYNNLFNPVFYDGAIFREIKDTYRTNEIGFFIGMSFFVLIGQ